MKSVILSFDYELFFGDLSGSVLKTLIEPTNRILDTLDSVNGKAVFFVDYLMLKRMKSESEKTQLEASIIEDQLKDCALISDEVIVRCIPQIVEPESVDMVIYFVGLAGRSK